MKTTGYLPNLAQEAPLKSLLKKPNCLTLIAALTRCLVVATLLISGGPAEAWPRDSGIGSYSNVDGHGWTKVCCDYPYYYPRQRAIRRPRDRH